MKYRVVIETNSKKFPMSVNDCCYAYSIKDFIGYIKVEIMANIKYKRKFKAIYIERY